MLSPDQKVCDSRCGSGRCCSPEKYQLLLMLRQTSPLLPLAQENQSPMRDSSNFGGQACGSPASVQGSPMKLVHQLPLLGEGPLSPAVLRTLAIAGRQAVLLMPL